MQVDDENPYRASALNADSAEPLEPLPPLPPETPIQRAGKWLIALGLAIGIYGAMLVAPFSPGIAVVVGVIGTGILLTGLVMCRPTPMRVEEEQ